MSKNKSVARKSSVTIDNQLPQLPLRALREISDWLLDLAAHGADEDQEDLATVDRIRRVVHQGLAGRPIRQVSERDLLTVASLLATCAERDLGVPGIGAAMAVGYEAADHSHLRGCPLHGPTPVPFRRCVP